MEEHWHRVCGKKKPSSDSTTLSQELKTKPRRQEEKAYEKQKWQMPRFVLYRTLFNSMLVFSSLLVECLVPSGRNYAAQITPWWRTLSHVLTKCTYSLVLSIVTHIRVTIHRTFILYQFRSVAYGAIWALLWRGCQFGDGDPIMS
jgi:hypothetical protein